MYCVYTHIYGTTTETRKISDPTGFQHNIFCIGFDLKNTIFKSCNKRLNNHKLLIIEYFYDVIEKSETNVIH